MAKKLRFLFTLLFVMAATLSWGEAVTVNASKISSSPTTWTASNVTWNVEVNGGALGQNVTNSYAQVGTKNSPSTSISFSTSSISGTITKIAIDCASYNGLGTVAAIVDGNAFGNQGQSIPTWSSNKGGDVTFTGSASGDIVITMTNGSGGRAMYVKSITVTYTPSGSSGPVDPDVSFEKESVEVEIGSHITNTLTKPNDLNVTYSSNPESIATVDVDGKVTGVSVGNATITASWGASGKYNEGSESYAVTVVPAPAMVQYQLVTNVSELSAGDEILFVSKDGTKAMSTTQNTNNRGSADVTADNGIISLTSNQTTVQVVKLEGSNSGWYFNVGNGYLQSASSSSNNLKTGKKNDYSKATINISSKEATIIFGGSYTRNHLRYNVSSDLFSCYASTSSMEKVNIYKKISAASSVATPTFSPIAGTYFEAQSVTITCATEGAAIYYTTDGTEPTSASTLYTSAIPISETTTLKAIAIKDNESSYVATAEYTIAPTYENNNAANVAATSTDSPVRLTLTEALVVYKNGNNTYLKDASGGMLIYGENNLNVGDKVTGHVDGDLTLYSGLPEIKKPVFNVETVSQDNEVTATVVDAADLKANPMKYVNQYVKVSPAKFSAAEFTNKNVDITVGETELIVRNSFNLDLTFNTESEYVVSGIATIYNDNVQLYPTNTDSDIVELHFVAQVGEQKFETLQAAVDAAYAMTGDVTVELISNVTEYVVIRQKEGLNLTVDGGNKTLTGEILIDGMGHYTSESLTIKNIKFAGNKENFVSGKDAFILIPKPSTLPSPYAASRLNDAHNVIITDCDFTSTSSSLDVVGVKAESNANIKDITIKNVTGKNLHSLAQLTGTTGGTIDNCTITESENFVNVSGGAGEFTVSNNTFTSCKTNEGYAVRENAESTAIITLTNNNFTAFEVIKIGKSKSNTKGTINVVDGKYKGSVVKDIAEAATGKIVVSGGIFSERVADEYLAEGKICASNTDEETSEAYPFIVREGHYRAQVGEQKYEFFADAVEALTEENNVVTLLADVEDEYTLTVGQTLNVIKGEFALTVNAPECYELKISEADGITTYTSEAPVIIAPAAPIVFHDSGEYEAGLSVPMFAQAGEIYYTIGESTKAQKYTGPLTINENTKITAWSELSGVKSAVVTREYTIKAAAAEIEAIDGYYSIKNNGNEKYINVAGRKTVTFVADGDEADKAGTVLKVKINTKGQVEELRSQGIDLPGYAKKAMNYVPEIVELVVNKLHAEGSGEILGEHGLDAIMQKFNDSFDYHLYVEKADAGYRIYGKTPSMKPVVDFYAENKDNVDYKLPQLEAFINSAIQKVLQKTGGRGASILTEFKLHDIWQKMGETLTEPVKDDAASIAKFYEEVLASEANVWNFAYQTAMIYWNNVKSHPRYEELKGKLGEYANYIEKVENIQPDFKYYIVGNTSGNGVDFISEGNIDIQNNAARTIWTLEPRADFKVTFDPENVKNGGTEYYATLYTDFGYELADGMKAYKVTEVDSKGYAKLEEIGTQIPAQTPVLLMTTDLSKTTLTVKDGGDAVTGNLLVGPDYLINEYQIKTAQVEGLFNIAKDIMGESFYDYYVKKYEHLMMRNAGTVNNKYFFGMTVDGDVSDAYKAKTGSEMESSPIRILGPGEKKLGFYSSWDALKANEAFIVNEEFNPVKLVMIGDVTRDGKVDVEDVTAVVTIILTEKEPPYGKYPQYDYDAADTDDSGVIDVTDLTNIVNMSLEKTGGE